MIEELRDDMSLAGIARRRGYALGNAAQRRGALKTATRALEGVVLLWGTILVLLMFVDVHITESRVLKPVSCRRLVVYSPCRVK